MSHQYRLRVEDWKRTPIQGYRLNNKYKMKLYLFSEVIFCYLLLLLLLLFRNYNCYNKGTFDVYCVYLLPKFF